jgi:hypothetical protein
MTAVEIQNKYLSDFINALKEEYKEDNGFEWEINEEGGFIKVTYCDCGEYFELFIDLNEYKVPVKLYMTKASFYDEIFVPENCDMCSETCEYYDKSTGECTYDDSEFEKEVNEWEKTLFSNDKITIRRVVVTVGKDIHYYLKGYEIVLNESLLPQTVIGLDYVFDIIISLVEK